MAVAEENPPLSPFFKGGLCTTNSFTLFEKEGKGDFNGYSGFFVKKYSPQKHRVRKDRKIFYSRTRILCVLRASAVQFPSAASQESLKTHFN